MATENSKVAGVAAAVKKAKGKPAKKHGKPKAKPPKATKPRKKKVAAKKAPSKKTAEKKIATSGQSGPSIELSTEGLNAKEGKVFAALNGPGSGVRTIFNITELAEHCFKSQGRRKSNSWTRNSLRRLVQAGLAEKVDRGKYRVSDAGRKKLARAA